MLYVPCPQGLPRNPAHNIDGYRNPAEYGIKYEEQHIETKDGESICVWLMLQANSKSLDCPTVIYFHGNAGNIGTRLPYFNQIMTELDCNILAVDYRGSF